jgi:hypothetical protein
MGGWPTKWIRIERAVMTRVTVDAELKRKLLHFSTPLELCDEAGQVVARLLPSTPWNDPENWVELTPPVSDEELERRMNSDEPTYSTQELLDQLRQQ